MTPTETTRMIDEVVRNFRLNPLHDNDVPTEWLTEPPPKLVGGYLHWRDQPATDKQLAYLRILGHKTAAPMTKGEACDLIGELKASR